MVFSTFDTNFSNQGVRMKIKEIEIKNSKTHALVYIWRLTSSRKLLHAVIPVIMLFSTGHKIEVLMFASKYV